MSACCASWGPCSWFSSSMKSSSPPCQSNPSAGSRPSRGWCSRTTSSSMNLASGVACSTSCGSGGSAA
eukprot:13566832-Heterocapsa_arctica.AAC.1